MRKEQITIEENIFWDNNKGKIEINSSKLVDFLSAHGFAKAMTSETDYLFVRVENNLMNEVKEFHISNFIQEFLKKNHLTQVYEVFVKGISSYITRSRLELLKTIPYENDRDNENSTAFYFNNCFTKVYKFGIKEYTYEELDKKVWQNRILQRSFYAPKEGEVGDFERFIHIICKNEEDRIQSFKSILGYLLHRHQDLSCAKAIIFMDENISGDSTANGGTGKGIIGQALSHCREVETMDGKNIKTKSWFKYQRVTRTTDIIFYDDVPQDFNLEELYSIITNGMQIEKKHKDEIFIPPHETPKILIASNYTVRGTGGSTDRRRRFEFEIANYYSDKLTPMDEFGRLFFEQWDEDEWNKFYYFMMECAQVFLDKGLIPVKSINLEKNKLINETSKEFYEFMKLNFQPNRIYNKRDFQAKFVKEYPSYQDLSPHSFSKSLSTWAEHNNLDFKTKSSGGNYLFTMNNKKD
ncbi:primase-helicase family protein [Galbibacter orientalis]|uniref:SF3 helicase domain-containing protein n=1 Tax=Galbibacter orientalis DSM 19592 TaxID=926559 RepID=I3C3B6_9FLAO|nr:primase-helicase family protein [Galbibacter orientalis]EIJ38109.1 hypothetical protein JoomaDRAFT_1089 [Galbibacter orientalis DSM 19592]